MIDNHLHLLNRYLAPDTFSVGQRLSLSRAEFRVLLACHEAVKAIHLPEPVDDILDAVDRVLRLIPATSDRWAWLKRIVRLYFAPTLDYLREMDRMCEAANVQSANILVINGHGVTRKEVARLIEYCQDYRRFRVFVPYTMADLPGAAGIKFYPALGESIRQAVYAAVDFDLPVVTHASPRGGIRKHGMDQRTAELLNGPGMWRGSINDCPIRLCFAHAGGCSAFTDWHLHDQHEPGKNWALDNLLRDACPGMSEVPAQLWVDTAFHESTGTERYARAAAAAQAWWRMLPGSDWPLNPMPYDEWADHARVLWPDAASEYERFMGGE